MIVRPLEGSLLFRVWGFLDREWRQGHQVGSQPSSPSPRRNRPGDREKALAVLLPLVYSLRAQWHLTYIACVAVSIRTCSSALASRMLGTGSRPITGKGPKRVDSGLS